MRYWCTIVVLVEFNLVRFLGCFAVERSSDGLKASRLSCLRYVVVSKSLLCASILDGAGG